MSFMVSFSATDIWSWLHHFCWLLHRGKEADYDFALNLPKFKEDIIYYLLHSADHGLGWMPEKRALPIAEWAFDLAVRKKYLLPAGEKDGRKYYTFAAMLARKVGRPKNE